MSEPFVVVGGDTAGLSAASKCKREDPDREVIVYEKSDWISYAHCGMPYYVKGEVDSIGDLLSLSPSEVRERGIDLHRNHEVVDVDPDRQTVRVDSGGDTFEQAATAIKASLASGAHHRYSYTLEGKEVPGAYRDSLKGLVSEYEPKRHVERGETVNADLVDKYDLLEFLGKRIAIAGPVVSCIDQLQSLDEIEGLDGILVPTLVVDDEWDLLTQFGDDIMPAV